MARKGGWRPSPPFLALTLLSLMVLMLAAGAFFRDDPGQKAGHYSLVVISACGGKGINFPVEAGDLFTIKYTHSVDILPVYEDFQVAAAGEFILLQTRQHAFGAGLGDWQGEVKFEDGLQVIKNIDKSFSELHLRVGRVANHTMLIGGTETPLSQVFQGGDLVVVRIDDRK